MERAKGILGRGRGILSTGLRIGETCAFTVEKINKNFEYENGNVTLYAELVGPGIPFLQYSFPPNSHKYTWFGNWNLQALVWVNSLRRLNNLASEFNRKFSVYFKFKQKFWKSIKMQRNKSKFEKTIPYLPDHS